MVHLVVIALIILDSWQIMSSSPLSTKLPLAICRGWTTSPTTRSVVAKQASDTLDLVGSWRLVFTVTITKMFNKMTKGQLRALTAILKMISAWRARVILSGLELAEEEMALGHNWVTSYWLWYGSCFRLFVLLTNEKLFWTAWLLICLCFNWIKCMIILSARIYICMTVSKLLYHILKMIVSVNFNFDQYIPDRWIVLFTRSDWLTRNWLTKYYFILRRAGILKFPTTCPIVRNSYVLVC